MIPGKANGINIGINLRKMDLLPEHLRKLIPKEADDKTIKILAYHFTNNKFADLGPEDKLAHITMAERIANGQFKDKNGLADNPNIQRAFLVLSYKYQSLLFGKAIMEVTVQKMIEYGLQEYFEEV